MNPHITMSLKEALKLEFLHFIISTFYQCLTHSHVWTMVPILLLSSGFQTATPPHEFHFPPRCTFLYHSLIIWSTHFYLSTNYPSLSVIYTHSYTVLREQTHTHKHIHILTEGWWILICLLDHKTCQISTNIQSPAHTHSQTN